MDPSRIAPEDTAGEPTLRRSIGLWQMTLYGAGGMLGAGIYGLIGKVAAEVGSAIWLAFALSIVAAGLTGLSYASLAGYSFMQMLSATFAIGQPERMDSYLVSAVIVVGSGLLAVLGPLLRATRVDPMKALREE